MPHLRANRDRSERKSSLRILCAEDDQPLAAMMKYCLQKEGQFVECVADGQTALNRLRQDLAFFDLLITDHNMPRLSGLQLVEELRKIDFQGWIIIHSSQLSLDEVRAYRQNGVEHLLLKPFQTSELPHLVRSLRKPAASEKSPP